MVREDARGFIMVGTIVDDSSVAYEKPETWAELIANLRLSVPIDDSPLTTFAGITVDYDRERGIMKLTQTGLIDIAVTRFGLDVTSPFPPTPLDEHARLDPDDCPDVADEADVALMQSMVGTLGYLANITRPTLRYAMSVLSRVCRNPSKAQLSAANRALRYLVGTKRIPLVFKRWGWKGPDGTVFATNELAGYVDCGMSEPRAVQRRPRKGHVGMCNGGAVFAKSQVAKVMADSMAKGELVSLHRLSVETMASRQTMLRLGDFLFKDFRGVTAPTRVFEDNSAVISIMTVTSNASQSRHFEIKYFYTADLIKRGEIELLKIETQDQLADGFTKPLPPGIYARHRFYVNGLHLLSADKLLELGLEALY
mmetsp:Transcript_36589/g.92025  ORF Transcript_36589/g.92025 Transcript_36589/m.92025 type:complete len:368 (+) Transcript_36589:1524-2627(+)